MVRVYKVYFQLIFPNITLDKMIKTWKRINDFKRMHYTHQSIEILKKYAFPYRISIIPKHSFVYVNAK